MEAPRHVADDNHENELTGDRGPRADILVVDDTIANLQLLSGMLKEEGYRVRPVPSGALALRAANSQKPDLVLLDINMPEMDGYDVCRRLKADRDLSDVPVIFISALSETLDKVKAFQVGGIDYVTKPFQFEEVRARVQTHLRVQRLQHQLRQRNEELREKNRTLEELKAMEHRLTNLIIHDLRAPLAGIIGYLELLQINSVGSLDDTSRGDIDKALSVAGQMNEMVNSLLDITRLEEARMPIESSRSDLLLIADEAMESLESIVEYRNLGTEKPSHPVWVECDPRLTRRIIVNLLHNAIKYTPRDGQITLRVESRENSARVSVQDNGPGIAPQYREQIFRKFGLGEIKARDRSQSAGLGLSFCKLATEAQGGEIRLEEAPGGGSLFWFELPLTG